MGKRNVSTYKTAERNFGRLRHRFGTGFIPRTTDTNRASSKRSASDRASILCSVSLSLSLLSLSVPPHQSRRRPSANRARGKGPPRLGQEGSLRDGARHERSQSFHSLVSELCTGVVAGVLGA